MDTEEQAPVRLETKTCTCCGRVHDVAGWAALPLKGYVGGFRAGGKLYAVELRNCPCASTLAVEVEVEPRTAVAS